MDGFRWDYTHNANTPTLDSLKRVGVMAEAIIPSFPTKTFPNHYSMATGLYPDHHGIVLNGFYANDLQRDYNKSDKSTVQDSRFYGGEPIWTTAELQGIKTATFFWVGSEAESHGIMPTYWEKYNESIPFESRSDSVYNWLSLADSIRPHLIMWYYHEPDGIGHRYGPESKEIISEVEKLDSYLADFFTKMRTLPNFDEINFVVTSDHGMGSITPENSIILDDIIDTADLAYFDGWNPVWNLKVKDGKLKKVYDKLKKEDQLQVWYHDSIPKRLNYGSNPRTLDITVAAKPNYSIYWSWRIAGSLGTHGYDNNDKDMYAIFYAAGPAFKNNYIAPAFENVNLYPLIAKVMNLQPTKTDGMLDNVENMLVETK
ncbi:MAG: alkaline phosphatase family protein [Bacteroidetes bacterium]|nr:alkaline phosphatase family protein [Bacteroidota bacterium]